MRTARALEKEPGQGGVATGMLIRWRRDRGKREEGTENGQRRRTEERRSGERGSLETEGEGAGGPDRAEEQP